MSVVIAGRVVQKDDPLYHTGFQAWGTVSGFDGQSVALLRLTGANGSPRTMRVLSGGIINGVRTVFWHQPLVLDLPQQDIGQYQRLVDAIKLEFGP